MGNMRRDRGQTEILFMGLEWMPISFVKLAFSGQVVCATYRVTRHVGLSFWLSVPFHSSPVRNGRHPPDEFPLCFFFVSRRHLCFDGFLHKQLFGSQKDYAPKHTGPRTGFLSSEIRCSKPLWPTDKCFERKKLVLQTNLAHAPGGALESPHSPFAPWLWEVCASPGAS